MKTKMATIQTPRIELRVIGYVVRHKNVYDTGLTEPMLLSNIDGDDSGGPDARLWFSTDSTLFRTIEDAKAAIKLDQGSMSDTCVYKNADYFIDPVYVVA